MTADIVIVEGIAGVWHYHIARKGSESTAICGARTMASAAPIDSWGHKPSHMPTSYCRECGEFLQEQRHD